MSNRLHFPKDTVIDMPYYGDTLHRLARMYCPLITQTTKKDIEACNFNTFFHEVEHELGTCKTKKENDIDFFFKKQQTNTKNITRTIEKIDTTLPLIGKLSLKLFLRDAYLYIFHTGIKTEVDNIIKNDLFKEPDIIIAHSLAV